MSLRRMDMPTLNWDKFSTLPGAPDFNFEALCRVLINRHYGQYGEFRGLAQQPGVEFHLKLESVCVLSEPGRWWGWQCRWYDIPSGRAIGTRRRGKIEDAIFLTAKVLPDLTDWVLWTRHPLTAGDQKWFYALKTEMSLHLWTGVEVEEYLSGPAEIFRQTYFGDLVLTTDDLIQLHQESAARIAERWKPNLHQTIDAERTIQKQLGYVTAWEGLGYFVNSLDSGCLILESHLDGYPSSLKGAVTELINLAKSSKLQLERALDILPQGDLGALAELVLGLPIPPKAKLLNLPRKLRSQRHVASLVVTNLIADIRSGLAELNNLIIHVSTRQTAIVAEYGCGKTHLSAQATAPGNNRPAGILLHGRDLSAGSTLDLLASTVTIQGHQVSSMEALIAAVDAAGRRAKCRLPVIIDGLNEAEDPRDWKGLLASIDEILKRYPHTLLVTTLRPEFAAEALPTIVGKIGISGFDLDANDAIKQYFEHYRIDTTETEFPLDLLSHPLTLQIFCEVVNPDRKQQVGVESIPRSLSGLFDRYLEDSSKRIAEVSPHSHQYYEQDVRAALYEIGAMLWEDKSLDLSLQELRQRLQDEIRPWNESLIRALEQGGVLLRVSSKSSKHQRVAVIYDALAGHLIADNVLADQGSNGFKVWLEDPITQTTLTGAIEGRHPLADDTIRAFVGLVPRKFSHNHFWMLIDEPLRTVALREAANLEGKYIDAKTVDELVKLIAGPPCQNQNLFDRLLHTLSSPYHPLNSDFLDKALGSLDVAERDLRWIEWVRRNYTDILMQIKEWKKNWKTGSQRSPSDRLRAQWTKWVLTSTSQILRDEATQALYWYGRGIPDSLFEMTVDSLSINDAYVSERLLAASYGVVTANQFPSPVFANILGQYLNRLNETLIGPLASHPTNDQLVRTLVQDTAAFALHFCPDQVPEDLQGYQQGHTLPFRSAAAIEPLEEGDVRRKEVESVLRMDFENYTLGRLFDDRRNYDMDHPGHKAAVAYVLGTVWALGWRINKHGSIDEELSHPRRFREAAERYGKKYSWIGFRAYAGLLRGRQTPIRRSLLEEPQIDPSFPEESSKAPVQMVEWTEPKTKDNQRWLTKGKVKIPNQLLIHTTLGSQPARWVAVHGYLADKKQELGREVFGFLDALLVDARQIDVLMEQLRDGRFANRLNYSDIPRTYETYAAEIPWSPRFEGDDSGSTCYIQKLQMNGGSIIEVELLSHMYVWESSGTARYLEEPVPSKLFSTAYDLKASPQSFDQVFPNGEKASRTFGPPEGFLGHLLYLREDLVIDYADGRELIWLLWGERHLLNPPREAPQWLSHIYKNHVNLWRYIVQHSKL